LHTCLADIAKLVVAQDHARVRAALFTWPSQLDPFDQAVTSKSSVVVKTDDVTFTSQSSSSITCVRKNREFIDHIYNENVF
jgi:hypothetical protein